MWMSPKKPNVGGFTSPCLARAWAAATELQHARLVLIQRQPELGEPHLHILGGFKSEVQHRFQ